MVYSQNEGFSSVWGFILVTIGFAVGVGSLWRFPYVCGTNGGALFVLTYILVILVIGIPLLTAEITMGFATQKTAIGAYKALAPKKKWFCSSYLHILVAVLVLGYTAPIYAWVLAYIWRTATGFFVGMNPTAIATSFTALGLDFKTMFLFAAINWALVALVVQGGLQAGVEKLNKILLPLLAVIMVICIVIGLNVEGSYKGIEFLLKPNIKDFSFTSVTMAVGQAFFAIGIGMLASMIFGSYLKNKKENVLKNATIISGAIVASGLAAGLMIFPLVFAFNLEPSAGAGLTLITLPNVFNYISGGKIVGTLFYIGFYLAAFSSSIGLCEAVVAVIMDGFHLSRRKSVGIAMLITIAIGSLSILNGNFFNWIDGVTSNYLLVISGFLIAVFVGWVWGIENFLEASNVKNKILRMWLKISVKYVCPIGIIIIFIGNFK